MTFLRIRIIVIFGNVATAALIGCIGDEEVELGEVSGVVTDAKGPVADALVEFYPVKGRPSHGKTGPSGRYELTYSEDRSGAVVGPHVIRVTTVGPAATPPSDDEEVLEVPAKTVEMPGQIEVAIGDNAVDIDLAGATPLNGSARGRREVLEPPSR